MTIIYYAYLLHSLQIAHSDLTYKRAPPIFLPQTSFPRLSSLPPTTTASPPEAGPSTCAGKIKKQTLQYACSFISESLHSIHTSVCTVALLSLDLASSDTIVLVLLTVVLLCLDLSRVPH